MDFVYLALLAALTGASAGYIHLCAMLEERK
jgi:hypothetical protein